MSIRIVVALLFAAGLCGPAAAHSPVDGIGVFYNGLLHPILVPAHLLALSAIGLLIGQHAPRVSRLALPAFAACIAFALMLTYFSPRISPTWPLAAITLTSGLAIALARSGGIVGAIVLTAAAAAAVALDSAPDAIPAGDTWLALCGAGVGAALIVTYFGGFAAWLDRPWQKIAIRAAGSWIAASAMLVLTLDLVSTGGTPS